MLQQVQPQATAARAAVFDSKTEVRRPLLFKNVLTSAYWLFLAKLSRFIAGFSTVCHVFCLQQKRLHLSVSSKAVFL
jgi:hypothetical protein